ncbi:MAG: efflux RND transporter periplasmic adaptor subunit [Minisyncoccia bacterium]
MNKYLSHQSFLNIKTFVVKHKILSSVIIIVILGVGYYGYGKLTSTTGETKYVTSVVKKGTLVSSVSGSGQVAVTNQLDVKAKVSGEITWVSVKVGDKVYAGQALAGMDNRQAKNAVEEAESALVQAKLQFQKDQVQAPIDYQKSLDDLANAQSDLITGYNDTFNSISNTYLDMPNIVVGMQNTLYGYDLSLNRSQGNMDAILGNFHDEGYNRVRSFADKAAADYKIARDKYDLTFSFYKQISRTSSQKDVDSLLTQSIDTVTEIAQSLQSQLNFISTAIDVANQYGVNLSTTVTTMQTNTRTRLSTTNSDLSSLLSQKKALDTTKQTIKTSEQNITLLKVGNDTGSNPISLQIAQNDLVKQERALEDLKTTLSYYTVTAPFAGTVASVSAKVGESAGTIASIITNQQVAQLSMNEIDAAKISLGQKVTLSFDAIDGLTLTGTIVELDPLGTVSQGVVSYTAKIKFDTQDTRVKPGMTVNADIQTAVHQDVLVVPSSAVKTTNGVTSVQVFDPPLVNTGGTSGTTSAVVPRQVQVTVGISSDTEVEILSGLTEGQQVVTRTIIGTTNTTTTTAPSATSLIGGGGVRLGN